MTFNNNNTLVCQINAPPHPSLLVFQFFSNPPPCGTYLDPRLLIFHQQTSGVGIFLLPFFYMCDNFARRVTSN